jgi:hypothetical protein
MQKETTPNLKLGGTTYIGGGCLTQVGGVLLYGSADEEISFLCHGTTNLPLRVDVVAGEGRRRSSRHYQKNSYMMYVISNDLS